MLGGHPICFHRAAYWYAQGVLEPEPEPRLRPPRSSASAVAARRPAARFVRVPASHRSARKRQRCGPPPSPDYSCLSEANCVKVTVSSVKHPARLLTAGHDEAVGPSLAAGVSVTLTNRGECRTRVTHRR
jgi:hypothetical protein